MQKPELKFKPTRILACATLAFASIGFSSGVAATTDAAQASQPQSSAASSELSERGQHKKMHRRGDGKRGHHRGHYRMGKAALVVPGYGPVPQDVVASLSLNSEQVALLDDAKAFIKDQRQSQRETFKSRKQSGQRSIDTPLDPRAALERKNEHFSAMQEFRSQASQKWLAVWDSLSSDQQQTLSDYMVKRSQAHAKRAADFREKRDARRANQS